MRPEFEAWPKIYRKDKGVYVITEDGEIYAASRKRYITPDDDNYGFAKWE